MFLRERNEWFKFSLLNVGESITALIDVSDMILPVCSLPHLTEE